MQADRPRPTVSLRPALGRRGASPGRVLPHTLLQVAWGRVRKKELGRRPDDKANLPNQGRLGPKELLVLPSISQKTP